MKKMFRISLVASSLLLYSCSNTPNSRVKKFEPTAESLSNYETPQWFRDAKLGMYVHWGVYSVPEMNCWYPRNMYDEGHPAYQHHVETYGHPSEFGYKDFIPMWKAENFNPDETVGLFKRAGAKYFNPCAVHHDNFDLWDSKHHRWNSVNMGPKKDLTAMWREAALKHGLRFGVTTHLVRSYSWFNVANQADTRGPKKGIPYDGDNPEYDDFYHKKHDDLHISAPIDPPVEWRETYLKRLKDLIDNYHPDLLYLDCSVPFGGADKGNTGMEMIAHFLNHNMELHDGNPEGVMCFKERYHAGLYLKDAGTLDLEIRKSGHLREKPWQTDVSIGSSWAYTKDIEYDSTDVIIEKLIDIVSKNGNLVLNIPIRADGTLDDETTRILNEMGQWMDINGEAIYGSRPWIKYGEEGMMLGIFASQITRYTTKGDYLYVFLMDWPGDSEEIYINTLAQGNTDIGTIESVEMLGSDQSLEWNQAWVEGFRVKMPDEKPCDFAYTLKIKRTGF